MMRRFCASFTAGPREPFLMVGCSANLLTFLDCSAITTLEQPADRCQRPSARHVRSGRKTGRDARTGLTFAKATPSAGAFAPDPRRLATICKSEYHLPKRCP